MSLHKIISNLESVIDDLENENEALKKENAEQAEYIKELEAKLEAKES